MLWYTQKENNNGKEEKGYRRQWYDYIGIKWNNCNTSGRTGISTNLSLLLLQL
jgi:hypothetical protein